MAEKYLSSTIQRAIDILNLFKSHPKLSFTQIQDLLGFNKSTLFRVLYTLEQNQYLSKDENGWYELGLNVFILGNRFSRASHIKKVASPYLKELSTQINLTVHLGILDGTEVVIIDKYDPPSNITMVSRIGATVPAHCTGQGKTLLAYSPPADVERVIAKHGLKQYTSYTITSKEAFFQELAKIRERGYAIDDSEHEKHIRCVAVPLLNERNEIEAALSVTGLIMDLNNDEAIRNFAHCLQQVRDNIARDLGFR